MPKHQKRLGSLLERQILFEKLPHPIRFAFNQMHSQMTVEYRLGDQGRLQVKATPPVVKREAEHRGPNVNGTRFADDQLSSLPALPAQLSLHLAFGIHTTSQNPHLNRGPMPRQAFKRSNTPKHAPLESPNRNRSRPFHPTEPRHSMPYCRAIRPKTQRHLPTHIGANRPSRNRQESPRRRHPAHSAHQTQS